MHVEDATTGKCMHEAGINLQVNKHFHTEFERLDFSPKNYFVSYCAVPMYGMKQLKEVYLDHCSGEVKEKDSL
jgi:hypothetical protein